MKPKHIAAVLIASFAALAAPAPRLSIVRKSVPPLRKVATVLKRSLPSRATQLQQTLMSVACKPPRRIVVHARRST
jgi:hypothetical protein